MNDVLETVCKSLDELSTAVTDAFSDDRVLTECVGWFSPALTRHEIAAMASQLAIKIRAANVETLDVGLESALKDVPQKLQLVRAHIVPNLFNANGGQAMPAYKGTIDWLAQILDPIIFWQTVDSKSMPPVMARRLRSLSASIENIVPDINGLRDQINMIQSATAAAESLPTDLEALNDARNKVQSTEKEVTKTSAAIQINYEKAETALKDILNHAVETGKLVSQCEDAYRITTTKGLAAAFDQRANRLGITTWIWVGGLIATLYAGAHFGAQRVDELLKVVSTNAPSAEIWLQLVLFLISLGAPIWFGWLATKQIGERFRLGEDYAFKASVAKAYEGYRREAAKLDQNFEARLFDSALSRLDEPPLRLVSNKAHGSPWHEFMDSEVMQRAFNMVPGLKDEVSKFFGHGMPIKFKGTKMPANEDIGTGTEG